MIEDKQAVIDRARAKHRRREEKRGSSVQPETRLAKVLAWVGLAAGAAILSIRTFLRWATFRKAD